MKIHLIFFLAFTGIYSYLNANNLYFDIGVSNDILRNGFIFTGNFNNAVLGFKTTYSVASGEIEGKRINHYNHNSNSNINARLGYRANEKFFMITEYQVFDIYEEFYYRISISWLGLSTPHIFHYKMTMKPIQYIGVGLVYYIHPHIHFSTTLGDARSSLVVDAISPNLKEGITKDCLSFGHKMSIAYDIPIKNWGLLLGGNFFFAMAKWENKESYPSISNITSIGIFLKLRY